jgi:hypothetical protein
MSIIQIGGQVAGISISAMGARVTGEPLEDTIENLMHQVASAEKCCRFVLGDLMNAASKQYGEKYARWSDITGLDIQALYNIASICKRVPIDMRKSGSISFTHHKHVAALPPADQEQWLRRADENGLSEARLAKSIKLGRIATADDMSVAKTDEADTGYENIHPFVNRLSSYLAKKERMGEYDDMEPHELYRFHLDVLPVVTRWGQVVRRIRQSGDQAAIDMVAGDIEPLGLSLN